MRSRLKSVKGDGASGHTPGGEQLSQWTATENNHVPAVVERSAKPLFVGSIPTRASKLYFL
jgi:hypothetical protein